MLVGLSAIETRLPASTVTVVAPETLLLGSFAVIVTGLLVIPTPVANPLVVIVTLVISEEVHCTILVISCVLWSLRVAVAVYCCCKPSAIGALAGVTAMLVMVALETVNEALPEIDPNVAVMVVWPAPTAVAKPHKPGALLMVATDVFDEVHVTADVMSPEE